MNLIVCWGLVESGVKLTNSHEESHYFRILRTVRVTECPESASGSFFYLAERHLGVVLVFFS